MTKLITFINIHFTFRLCFLIFLYCIMQRKIENFKEVVVALIWFLNGLFDFHDAVPLQVLTCFVWNACSEINLTYKVVLLLLYAFNFCYFKTSKMFSGSSTNVTRYCLMIDLIKIYRPKHFKVICQVAKFCALV